MDEQSRDDLTAIKGIGQVWQRRLQESLGIRTYQDLGDSSCAEIISHLTEKNQPAPSAGDCEAWISQAKELAKAQARKKNWKTIATFVIEFCSKPGNGESELARTTVHHSEADENEKWEHIATSEPCNWMLERASRSELASEEMRQHIKAVRSQAQRDLQMQIEEKHRTADKEIEEKHRKAKEEIEAKHRTADKEIEEERAKKHQELQEESQQQRETLKKELAKQRESETEKLEQQVQSERAQKEQAMAEEIKKVQQEAEQALAQQLEEAQEKGQEALDQALAKARANAAKELEEQLDAQRARFLADLQEELAQEQARARKEAEEQLAAELAKTQEELERRLHEMRDGVIRELEQKIAEDRLPAESVSEEKTDKEEMKPEPKPEPKVEEAAQPAAPAPASKPIELPPIALDISRLQAFQPAGSTHSIGSGFPGHSFAGSLSSSQTFAMTVDFELSGPATAELADPRITYAVQVFARNRAAGSKIHLGDSKPAAFSAGQSAYSVDFTDLSLVAGSYDLVLFVSLQNGRQIADYAEVQFFQVA